MSVRVGVICVHSGGFQSLLLILGEIDKYCIIIGH